VRKEAKRAAFGAIKVALVGVQIGGAGRMVCAVAHLVGPGSEHR